MEILNYKKINLINLFRLNNRIDDNFRLKLKNDISLKIQKNIFKFNNDKYFIEILLWGKSVYAKTSNNYIDLIDSVYNFLFKNKLITKEEIDFFKKEDESNLDEQLYSLANSLIEEDFYNPFESESIKKETKKIELKELNNFETRELKKELKLFFSSNSSEYNVFTRVNGNIEISEFGKEVKVFPPSVTLYKQFLIEYLLSVPKKVSNGIDIPDKIRIGIDYFKIININIHDFLGFDEKDIKDFPEEDNPFTLCSNNLFVMESSLNLFIDDIFKDFGIKGIKYINI